MNWQAITTGLLVVGPIAVIIYDVIAEIKGGDDQRHRAEDLAQATHRAVRGGSPLRPPLLRPDDLPVARR